jgi:mannose-1-phosphate guanylyltransferase
METRLIKISYNTKNNLVVSTHKTIALVDVEDLIIVETEDALLITKRGKSQNVKEIVESLKIGNELKQKLL